MKNQRDLCIKIFKEFYLFNSEIINKMKETKHFNFETIPDYHLENDVWTHTCLCFNHFLNVCLNSSFKKEFLISCVSAILCHDIGKIYTKKNDILKNKTTFHGHQYASIQDTINFLYHLNDLNYIDDLLYVMNLVLPSISTHMNEYVWTKNTKNPNNNMELEYINDILSICDVYGSITKNPKSIKIKNKKENTKYDSSLRTIFLYCGVPGTGKDYLAEKTKLPIFSFDDERIKQYIKFNKNIKNLTDKEIYDKAFLYCNKNKINLLKNMKKSINKIEGDVIVCNTNCNKKARNILLSFLGKANYVCIYVVAPTDTIIDRDNNRSSKNLGLDIINKFLYNQQIPTMKENFCSITIYPN